jgi:FixJ family two-component response regulator
VINRRLCVAIVDDEECVCKALARLLRSAGIESKTFPSGQDFLESLHTQRPDCVLLDLHMPGLTGFDVQTRLKENGARVPVIIITAQDSPAAHDRASAGGAADYLRKPVKNKILLEAIHRAVGEKNSSETLVEQHSTSPGRWLGKNNDANQQRACAQREENGK